MAATSTGRGTPRSSVTARTTAFTATVFIQGSGWQRRRPRRKHARRRHRYRRWPQHDGDGGPVRANRHARGTGDTTVGCRIGWSYRRIRYRAHTESAASRCPPTPDRSGPPARLRRQPPHRMAPTKTVSLRCHRHRHRHRRAKRASRGAFERVAGGLPARRLEVRLPGCSPSLSPSSPSAQCRFTNRSLLRPGCTVGRAAGRGGVWP